MGWLNPKKPPASSGLAVLTSTRSTTQEILKKGAHNEDQDEHESRQRSLGWLSTQLPAEWQGPNLNRSENSKKEQPNEDQDEHEGRQRSLGWLRFTNHSPAPPEATTTQDLR